MIINSDNFRAIPGLTSAVLAESTDGPSELSLTFMDGVPNPEFMGEVTVMHKGAVLFHGKVTGASFSNRSGEATRTVTVSDFRWALDKQTLGEQLISAGADDRDLAAAARAAMQDWAALADSSSVTAAGWICNADGSPVEEEATLSLDATRVASTALGSGWKRNSPISIMQALHRMKLNNPGTFLTVDYTAGKVKVLRRADMPVTTLDTLDNNITDISGISGNEADRVPGVLVVVKWDLTYNLSEGAIRVGTNQTAGKAVRIYPPDLPLDTMGVRVFSQEAHFSVNQPTNVSDPFIEAAEEQADKVLAQLIPWLEEVNTPAVRGSVTTMMKDWDASPLATRLVLTGPGSCDTMQTPVTAVEWDFMNLTTTLTLGNATREPKVTQLYPVQQQFHPSPDDPDDPGGGGGGGGDDPDDPGEDPDDPTPPGPGCNCNCQCKAAELMQKIQDAIDAALAGIQVQISVDGLISHTEFGELQANSRGDTQNGVDTNVHY